MTDTSATPPPSNLGRTRPDAERVARDHSGQDRADTTMPEVDWLTGLSSRLAFARQVTQADRDRDQFSVAIISVDDFAEVNRQLGHQIGDDLLRAIGRVLAMQTSVNTMAARLDGTQFGLLGLQIPHAEVQQWLRPIVSAARSAVEGWTADQVHFTGDCPVEPDLLIGTASGFSGDVWDNAAAAVEIASTDPNGRQLAHYDIEDPRFIALERRTKLTDRIAGALSSGGLSLAADRVETINGGAADSEWLRLAAFLEPSDGSGLDGVIETAELPSGLGRRIERWLIERSGGLIRSATGQARFTVPMGSEATAGRAFAERLFPLLEQHRIPPRRVLFEVAESTLIEAGMRGWEFARQVDSVGAGVVLTECAGGWATWKAMDGLSVAYLRPEPELVMQASNGNQSARRILSAMARNADDADRELIAPSLGIAGAILEDLGFTYSERPRPPEGQNTADGSNSADG